MAHLLGGTRRETSNRQIWKARAQPAQLAIIGTELVPPLRNTMRLVHREESDRNPAQPVESVLPGQPLRRKIQQAIVASLGVDHDLAMLGRGLKTVDSGRRNSHLRELRRLVLHESDQRR